MTILPGSEVKEAQELLSVAVDFNKRFPGEQAIFTIRCDAARLEQKTKLKVFVPKGLELLSSMVLKGEASPLAGVPDEDGDVFEWKLAGSPQDEPGLIQLILLVSPTNRDLKLSPTFTLLTGEGETIESTALRLSVKNQSNFMEFLPEIFRSNDFTGRFLMLFESFWQPISAQIGEVDAYFDPDLTPSAFLPWLASWIGVAWDVPISDEQKREILHKSMGFYQQRGTKQALQDFLEVYTGGKVKISEHKTRNLRLGRSSRLGHTIALGKQNLPHTFTVDLEAVPSLNQQTANLSKIKTEQIFQNMVEKLIDSQKPAHTAYELNIKYSEPIASNIDGEGKNK